MLDPQTFIGAIIVALVSGVVLLVIQQVSERRRRQDRPIDHVAAGRLSVGTRLAYSILYGRGLRRFLSEYREQLKSKLAKEPWARHYIGLSVLPVVLKAASALSSSDRAGESHSVPDAVREFAPIGLVILGDSGAGKSTSLRRVAQMCCDEEKMVPIMIELRNYRQPDYLMTLIAQEVGNRTWLTRGLRLGYFLLLLDGLNEIPQEIIPSFNRDLALFRAEYPDTGVVVSCRPSEYSDNFPAYVHMKMQPLDGDSIKGFLGSVLGQGGEQLYATLDDRLLGLCQNPYMLTMLALTYRSTGKLPSNRAKLYEGFLVEFLVEESTKGRSEVGVSVKHDLLSDLAFYMDNRVVAIDMARAQSIVGKKLVQLKETFDHQYFAPDVLDELLSSGLVHLDFGNLSFMHQSVQEFYTARELAERLDCGKMAIREIGDYADDPRWSETLTMLAGLQSDATEMVKVVREKDLLLASECIYASNYVAPTLVDEAIVQAVTEFKFGAEPFNYPLIFSLKRISDRRSENLSQRVIDDMTHWCNKFASTAPRVLVGMETDALLRMVSERTNPYLMPDIMWTLGVRKEVRAVNPLIDLLLDKSSTYRADAARALGRIGDKRASAALLACIAPSEPRELRPFCFMALGSIADRAAFTPLMEYLSNVNNPYRETAAWALLGVVDESIGGFLVENLQRGHEYLRAIYVYLLGRLKLAVGLSPLIKLMAVEHSAFVREDIAFALGEYKDESAIPVLIDRLGDEDSLVRTRVAEALGKIGGKQAVPHLRALLTDESNFVRESVRKALRQLGAEETN